jgi:competence protein ComGC
LKQIEQKWVSKANAQQTRTRLMLVQLAARAYELEKGERPKNLADLVPAYLKAIPQDPLTGTNMVLR